VRRILSISLLLLFALPLVSPLFAASIADANVPICCRRDGKHHCMMMAAVAQHPGDGTQAKTASLHDRCPYNLAAAVTFNLPFIPDEIQATVSASILSSSASPAPSEAAPRMSPDRSHQKRGPPSLRLFLS
jgi:hypothetical protein